MTTPTELTVPSRTDRATAVLLTVRKGLSTATWLCDELLGVLERGSQR